MDKIQVATLNSKVRLYFQYKDIWRLKITGWKKVMQKLCKHKKIRMAMLILIKIDFKTK